MRGYIYITTQFSSGSVYVGQHVGRFDPSYLGSGLRIKRAIKKYGLSDFGVHFLEYAKDQSRLDELEKCYINEVRELYGPEKVFNIADGGLHTAINGLPFMSGRKHSEETKAKMSLTRRGENNGMHGVRLCGELNPCFGRKHTIEEREKISAAHQRRKELGLEHGNTGAVRSEETRRKISKAKKGQVSRAGWKMSEEQKRKISVARKARFAAGYQMVFTEETRKKISEGRKRFWAAKKELNK